MATMLWMATLPTVYSSSVLPAKLVSPHIGQLSLVESGTTPIEKSKKIGNVPSIPSAY